MKQNSAKDTSSGGDSREVNIKSVENAVNEISTQLRSNLATIRSFFHFLEIGQYKATEQELREMHAKLDAHLEKSQAQLVKKLNGLSDLMKEQVKK